MSSRSKVPALVLLGCVPLLLGCGVLNSILPPPTPTPTHTPTSTPTPLPSPTPTRTPSPTHTPTGQDVEPNTRIEVETDGSRRFIDGDYGYTIRFPQQWLVLELTAGDFEQMFAEASDEVPELDQFEQLVAQLGPGARMYAMDLTAGHSQPDFQSNVNVLVAELPTSLSLEFLVTLNAQSLPQLLPGVEVLDSQVFTNAQQTELGLVTYTYLLGEGGPEVFIMAALLPSGDSIVTITAGSAAGLRSVMQPAFESIFDSVERIEPFN